MDPRAHITFNEKSSYILPEKVADFFVHPDAFKAFLETLDVANGNATPSKQAQQLEIQKAMLAQALAAQAAKNNWTPCPLPSTDIVHMAQQQQGVLLNHTPEQTENIRQRQYAQQVALLAASRLTP